MPEQLLFGTLREFGEKPLLSLISNRITDTDGDKEEKFFPMMLFANPSTGTWSLIEKHDGDKVCVVSIGQQMKPFGQ